jgi:bifunctional DNA-binding transcriptional regulator/antitoxin component of YhaV-PrlF toxin-antitoxin module
MSSVRIYPADQLSLPEEVSSAMEVKEGDFLEISSVGKGVLLRPTRIFLHGSPEAEEELRRAKRDLAEGRYRTFKDVESLAEYLGIPLPEPESEAGPIGRLIQEALSETRGDAAAAASHLERARRSLESQALAAEKHEPA